MEIVGSVKTYEWGKVGLESEVARLMQASSEAFFVDGETPYAELWMGDHPSGPSTLKDTGAELGSFLNENREDKVQLPFLFKVLSIRKALSIQIHPDKAEAERLHSARPDVYKDPNHKPELAIALTPFEALCGFRPYEEIHNFCKQLSPLAKLVGAQNVDLLKDSEEAVKKCYEVLMTAEQAQVEECISQILEKHCEDLRSHGILELFQRINRDFPGDVGVLCLFFFNVISLEPGEAIFLPANEPHAYLRGDCVECMACSDNVVRAGLTPKYKDVPTLIRLLNYGGAPARAKLLPSSKKDAFVEMFIPTVRDFAVAKISLPAREERYTWTNGSRGSILLVVRGARVLQSGGASGPVQLKRGSTVFIPADCKTAEFLPSGDESEEDFVAYLAMYNDFYDLEK